MTNEARRNMSKGQRGCSKPSLKGKKISKDKIYERIANKKWEKPMGKYSSNFLSVSFNKKEKLWLAVMKYENQYFYLGKFKYEIDAVFAYNDKVTEIIGKSSRINILFELN